MGWLAAFLDDLNLPQDAMIESHYIKEVGKNLFDPKRGGTYEVFNERPMRPAIIDYCTNNVHHLPKLYEYYQTGITKNMGSYSCCDHHKGLWCSEAVHRGTSKANIKFMHATVMEHSFNRVMMSRDEGFDELRGLIDMTASPRSWSKDNKKLWRIWLYQQGMRANRRQRIDDFLEEEEVDSCYEYCMGGGMYAEEVIRRRI